jgi:DNA invertase Pin-like site-specific DNA recombinase
MTAQNVQRMHCAIYTRKSTEHGIELEFNSLDAQREACEAYIKSQAHEGWRVLSEHYDDPAFSGASLDRPALQQLLADIDAGRVNIVVVYKIDRLTRSLSDFAKLVEIFDKKNISFVAVTQQFNTTTSMGRLTLNVLLSFAQFERELSSERVRDKVAASRRKGKWTGGGVPLGYNVTDKKLIVNHTEAATVRTIFKRYLELKCLRRLKEDLDGRGIVSKRRKTRNGRGSGGCRITRGALAHLLKNRTYLGEIGHKGQWFAGEHQPIIDQATFDQVQELMKANSVARRQKRVENGALLAGLVYDDRGNRMTPSFTTKRNIRYRFYVSTALLKGHKQKAGSLPRISGPDLEMVVLSALRGKRTLLSPEEMSSDREIVTNLIENVEVGEKKMRVNLKARCAVSGSRFNANASELDISDQPDVTHYIDVPWHRTLAGPLAHIEECTKRSAEPDVALVQAVARARLWMGLLINGEHTSIESLAAFVNMHPKVVRKGIRLAFLAPEITRVIVLGQQPPPLTLTCLHEASASLSWAEQQRNIRCGAEWPPSTAPLADMAVCPRNVRFAPKCGHPSRHVADDMKT